MGMLESSSAAAKPLFQPGRAATYRRRGCHVIGTFLQWHWRSLKTRVALSTLLIFVVSMWSLSFYASRMLRADMENLLGEQQLTVAEHVAVEINGELDDRLGALATVAGKITPAVLGNTADLQEFLEHRNRVLVGLFNGGVIAYRRDGTAIAEVPFTAERIGVNYLDVETVAAALKKGKSTIGRPVIGRKLHVPLFTMVVPILDNQGGVIGALGGVVDLEKPNFIDRITVGGYGRTGGFLLIAPQYRLVVTATDKSRIMQTLPAPGVNSQIDRYIQGDEGTAIYRNAVGVEILNSVKAIPAAGWYLAANLPTDEAFAPIYAMQRRMLLATILLTLLAGCLTWWMLRHQLSPLHAAANTLAEWSHTNQPPQPLTIQRPDEIGRLIAGFNGLLETLGQREAALCTALHEIEQKEHAKSRFLAATSHDLRQPLYAAQLLLDSLSSTLADPQQIASAKKVRQSLKSISRQLRLFLDMFRMEGAQSPPDKQEISSIVLFEEIAEIYAPIARQAKVRLLFHPGEFVLHSDGHLLSRLLGNLIDNAIKFSPGGTVLVCARRAARGYKIQVRDNGQGIAADHHDAIFDDFFQIGNSERNPDAGYGLGLAIVNRIVRLLNGKLHLTSATGRGSVFSLLIASR